MESSGQSEAEKYFASHPEGGARLLQWFSAFELSILSRVSTNARFHAEDELKRRPKRVTSVGLNKSILTYCQRELRMPPAYCIVLRLQKRMAMSTVVKPRSRNLCLPRNCKLATIFTENNDVENQLNFDGYPDKKCIFIPMGLTKFEISLIFRNDRNSLEFEVPSPKLAVIFNAQTLVEHLMPFNFADQYPGTVFAGTGGRWHMEYTGNMSQRSTHQSCDYIEPKNLPIVGLAFSGENVRVSFVQRTAAQTTSEGIQLVLQTLRERSGSDFFKMTAQTAFALRFTPSCEDRCRDRCIHRIEEEEFGKLFPNVPLITFCSKMVFGHSTDPEHVEGASDGAAVPLHRLQWFNDSTFFVIIEVKKDQNT